MSQAAYFPLRVAAVQDETADAKSVTFAIPPELSERFAYKPGQFLTLRLPIGGKHVPRCYSMSSTPGLDDAPRVTVKRVAGGRGSNWICDTLQAGSTVEVMSPSGIFVPRDLTRHFVLFAGGSGITPILSILRAALAHNPSSQVALFYANRDAASIIFKDTLNALQTEYGERLQVTHWLDSEQGVVTTKALGGFLQNAMMQMVQPELFVCGPAPFMDAVERVAEMNGMPEDDVHVERFVSLPDEEDAAAQASAAAADAPQGEGASVTALLWGETHHFECQPGETLLEAALRAKIQAPYSCQAGLCSACMCKLEEGEVHMRHNEALGERELARGMVLSCQSVPLTPTVRIRYPD